MTPAAWESLTPVLIGTAATGAVAGAVGTLAVARREALQGDAVSHAALPGVAIAVLLGQGHPLGIVLGSAATGWLALAAVRSVSTSAVTKPDAALAGTLATFFGLGLALLAIAQELGSAGEAGRAERYLFGREAATLRMRDLLAPLAIAVAVMMVVILTWKELVLASFDPGLAESLGYSRRRLDGLMATLVVLTVVVGVQTVGVILMSALLVAPAVAARQWLDRAGPVAILAATLGAGSGFFGVLTAEALSLPRRPVPTGPAVVLLATAVALASVLLAARRRNRLTTPTGAAP